MNYKNSRIHIVDEAMIRCNRSLLAVNEDCEHRPTANGGGAVDLEQVLSVFSQFCM